METLRDRNWGYVDKNLERHIEKLDVIQFCRDLTLEAALIKIRLFKISNFLDLPTETGLPLYVLSNIINSTRADNC